MSRVLVAGGCGFIGSHLVDRLLLRRDVSVLYVVDNLWTGLRQNLDHVGDRRLHFVQSDIDDVIDALGRFFWSDGSEFAGPLNIGADREVPVIEVAKYVQRCFPGSRLEFHPRPPQDPTNRRPDLRLARQMLPGWSADVTYEQGVECTIDWFRRRLAGQRAGSGLEASA